MEEEEKRGEKERWRREMVKYKITNLR